MFVALEITPKMPINGKKQSMVSKRNTLNIIHWLQGTCIPCICMCYVDIHMYSIYVCMYV